jgi:Amt family ammonium transporter
MNPVGAISVHGYAARSAPSPPGLFSVDEGVFYGHGFKFFGIQVLGVVVVAAWGDRLHADHLHHS